MTAFLRTALSSRGPVSEAILRFNFALAAQVHPERLPGGAVGATLKRALMAPAGVRRLSLDLAWAAGGQGLEPCFEFEDPRFRLALLPGDVLELLLFRFGVTVQHSSVARLIAREDVLAARAALGAEAWEFALRRAPFLIAAAELQCLAERKTPRLAVEQIWTCGYQGLSHCLCEAPPALLARLRLKLPPRADGCLAAASSPAERREAAWAVMRRLALQEAPPSCAAFFN